MSLDYFPLSPSSKYEDEYILKKTKDSVLEIVEEIEDIVICEGENALFECKLRQIIHPCTWYKNGIVLHTDNRTYITQNDEWHRLEIIKVKATDQGVYSIQCFNDDGKLVSTNARLLIAPRSMDNTVFYYMLNDHNIGVVKHLHNLTVTKDEKIELKAVFRHKSEEYVWYKNNVIFDFDRRASFYNDQFIASLTIMNAEPTDTGVYFVVSKTQNKYVSSFGNVHVSERNERQELPVIVEYFPDEIEIVEGEELRITMRAYTDANTIISWDKDEVEIQDSDILKVDYGDCYLGVKIPKCTIKSVSEYRVYLQNVYSDHVKLESTNTIVTNAFHRQSKSSAEEKIVPVMNVLRPMESAVACCGSKVSFDCSFDIKDPMYFYVVWYIGHYRVERTNRLFNVVCGGGQFLLYIKNLEPSMSGEVICELRRAWPHKLSTMVKRIYARLDIVPPPIIQEGKRGAVRKSKLYYQQCGASVRIEGNEVSNDCKVDAGQEHPRSTPEYILKIVYCRLDDEGLYFLHATHGETVVTTRLTVHRKPTDHHSGTNITVIEWSDTILPTSCWYAIQLRQKNGSYVEVGVSSRPRFEVENPTLERIMVFNINTVQPMNHVCDLNVYIIPPPEIILRPQKLHYIQPVEEYLRKYRETKDVIGSGHFGKVLLVQDQDSNMHYAAKFLQRKTVKTEMRIFREFHIMKRLRHPKLIDLIDFYVLPQNQYVFVMEYCWGGELFDRIVEEEHITEVDVVSYVKQMCEGLEYIHEIGIIHLDLKPENIICLNPNTRQIKLIDFGLAKKMEENSSIRSMYGTRDYMSPEAINFENITTASDMWSLGVVIYMLLSGVSPFTGDSWPEVCANITRAKYDYDEYAFDNISTLAKNFVDQLLIRNPSKRITATEALAHEWIKHGPPKGSKSGYMKTTRANLKSYLADYKARWQRAGNFMIAANRLRRALPEAASSAEETPTLDLNTAAPLSSAD